MTVLDIIKTIFAGLFVWMMIKQLFPMVGDHPSSTEFLAILVMGFLVGCFYVSLLVASVEKELNEGEKK